MKENSENKIRHALLIDNDGCELHLRLSVEQCKVLKTLHDRDWLYGYDRPFELYISDTDNYIDLTEENEI